MVLWLANEEKRNTTKGTNGYVAEMLWLADEENIFMGLLCPNER